MSLTICLCLRVLINKSTMFYQSAQKKRNIIRGTRGLGDELPCSY